MPRGPQTLPHRTVAGHEGDGTDIAHESHNVHTAVALRACAATVPENWHAATVTECPDIAPPESCDAKTNLNLMVHHRTGSRLGRQLQATGAEAWLRSRVSNVAAWSATVPTNVLPVTLVCDRSGAEIAPPETCQNSNQGQKNLCRVQNASPPNPLHIFTPAHVDRQG